MGKFWSQKLIQVFKKIYILYLYIKTTISVCFKKSLVKQNFQFI